METLRCWEGGPWDIPQCSGRGEHMVNSMIKRQIEAALSHPEAEDGLYFNNLIVVHEEEERPIVVGDEAEVRAALDEMIKEGTVVVTHSSSEQIYCLA